MGCKIRHKYRFMQNIASHIRSKNFFSELASRSDRSVLFRFLKFSLNRLRGAKIGIFFLIANSFCLFYSVQIFSAVKTLRLNDVLTAFKRQLTNS